MIAVRTHRSWLPTPVGRPWFAIGPMCQGAVEREATVNVPIKRGTARRLGLRLPPGIYHAPLWTITETDLAEFTTKFAEALRGWNPGVWLEHKP